MKLHLEYHIIFQVGFLLGSPVFSYDFVSSGFQLTLYIVGGSVLVLENSMYSQFLEQLPNSINHPYFQS
jgi:hypothetical protein